MPSWTPEEYAEYQRKLIAAENRVEGIRSKHAQPTEGVPLVSPEPREETRWYGPAKCFEITFIVYAQRPCDWDNYFIKAIQDLCCHAGILPADKWSVLSGRVISRKAHSKEEEKTEILVTAVNH